MSPFIYMAGSGIAPLFIGLVKLPVNPTSNGGLITE
jgi:hypothetical protein